mgnify:FL=1
MLTFWSLLFAVNYFFDPVFVDQSHAARAGLRKVVVLAVHIDRCAFYVYTLPHRFVYRVAFRVQGIVVPRTKGRMRLACVTGCD